MPDRRARAPYPRRRRGRGRASNPSGIVGKALEASTGTTLPRRPAAPARARPARPPAGRQIRAPACRAPGPRTRSASIGAAREARNAGPVPKSDAVSTAIDRGARQDPPVEREIQRTRACPASRGSRPSRGSPRPAKTRPAAAPSRQHEALDEQLPGEPPARRAERQPHAQLVAARGRAESSRFAMFTHAMSSTSATTARIVSSGRA